MDRVVWDQEAFGRDVKATFAFLEPEFGMAFSGLRETRGDPRDRAIIATYDNDSACVQIAWGEMELGLVISIQRRDRSIPKKLRWIYFEPFVEYLTDGKTPPIVPQVYYWMPMRALTSTMRKRRELFSDHANEALAQLAARLRTYLNDVLHAKRDTLVGYHSWFNSGGTTK
jgi:hypothetical protein